ncbi:MAG TPA: ferrochelatase [Candidatus Binatia bacterium]|nr:ferrochelatase [Candidatus Binatia bacterium]
MSQPYQAILLIAFGGPASPQEVRPFLERVTKGLSIPTARLEEVAHHYEAVGGKSPLNEITYRQAAALRRFLPQRGLDLPVYVGLRNSTPFFRETLEQMKRDRIRRALGFILSSHRTEASWERYQKNIAEARAELGQGAPEIDYCLPWHEHPLFVQTWAEAIQAELAKVGSNDRQAVPVVFTAHSIPTEMAKRSEYVDQLQTSARLVAEKLVHPNWSVAYQSRSGKPADSWLEPDVGDVIRKQAAQGIKQLIVAPIGFVCDHVEVLYDLDIEAKKIAEAHNVQFLRTSCPNDSHTFIRMIGDVIESRIRGIEDRE